MFNISEMTARGCVRSKRIILQSAQSGLVFFIALPVVVNFHCVEVTKIHGDVVCWQLVVRFQWPQCCSLTLINLPIAVKISPFHVTEIRVSRTNREIVGWLKWSECSPTFFVYLPVCIEIHGLKLAEFVRLFDWFLTHVRSEGPQSRPLGFVCLPIFVEIHMLKLAERVFCSTSS